MNISHLIQRYCSVCNRREEEVSSIHTCKSCLSSVCGSCSNFKSPIPFLDIQKRVRICKRCVFCYSNYSPTMIKDYKYSPSFVDFSQRCYSLYAKSKCCNDIYCHLLREGKFSTTSLPYEITPLWIPDCTTHSCCGCNSSFTCTRRKHHCRLCGRIFCNKCSSNRLDLSKYGYPTSKCKLQRVCDTCTQKLSQTPNKWDMLPFQVKTTIASFLNPKEVVRLSQVNTKTHHTFTSYDFDQIYWRFICQKSSVSFYPFLQNTDDVMVIDEDDEPHLYIRLSETFGDNEISGNCCIEGCYWRIRYLSSTAIRSLHSSLALLSHQLIIVRTAAMKYIHGESCRDPSRIETVLQDSEIMHQFVRSLQLANNDIKRRKTIVFEMQQLLVATTGCLLNATPTSVTISTLFRESGGITTILSLLQNECFQTQSTLSVEGGGSRSSSSLRSRSSSHSQRSIISSGSDLTRKILTYLVGILMNICKLDVKNCKEIGQLNGVQCLVSFLQYSQELLNVYCLQCLKATCKADSYAKDCIGNCGGLVKLMNCYVSSNTNVIMSAIGTTTTVVLDHPDNLKLFCHANGLNSLMQVEERWKGKCGVYAAKAISNLLRNPIVVSEFLQQQGLMRLNSLIRHHRKDINGILLGQLMNCMMYSGSHIPLQSSLIISVIRLIQEYIQMSQSILNDISSGACTPSAGEQLQMDISKYLGYGAGFFTFASSMEENYQLMLDYNVVDLLKSMKPYCDSQGVAFISFL